MNLKGLTFTATLAVVLFLIGSKSVLSSYNTNPPASPVKLIFIHHSCGENWLADYDGGLGIALRDNKHNCINIYKIVA